MEHSGEELVFEAIRMLVADGEYLDDIPGIAHSAPGRGGTRASLAGAWRPVYRRGSPEHLQARKAGMTGRMPVLATAPAAAVQEAEAILGTGLPPLLRRLYLEIGNGGFGPGYGILGLGGGHRDDTGKTAVDLYRQARGQPSAGWSFLPAGLLPVCHWGCAIYSFTDCSHADGPMWGWDPNPGPAGVQALFPQRITLAQWLGKWVNGALHQPALVPDPVTGQWRGATDEEHAQWTAEMDEPGAWQQPY